MLSEVNEVSEPHFVSTKDVVVEAIVQVGQSEPKIEKICKGLFGNSSSSKLPRTFA